MDNDERRALEADYNREVFAKEDDVLAALPGAAKEAGLPSIQISGDVGRMLQVLIRSIGARRALEVGTLGGYSGTWITRALPADGSLLTLEISEKHKAFAEDWFQKTGVSERVEVRLGPALESLAAIPDDEPFDFVFIDADKVEYPEYLKHARRLVRPGGIITADNSLSTLKWPSGGDHGPVDRAMREYNALLADDPEFTSIILPMRQGVTVSVRN